MMLDKLIKTGRGHWLDEEMEKLADPANYSVDPDKAWQRIKVPTRKLDVLGRLQSLAAWREREARQKNLPRGRIVKDETLADLAAHPPKDQDRSEEHTSELQSLLSNSYAVFCLKKK